MQKLLMAPALAGLAVSLLGTGASLLGTTQPQDTRASGVGHRLSSIQMKSTQGGQGAGYACSQYVCSPSFGQLSCVNGTNSSTSYDFTNGKACYHTGNPGDSCTNTPNQLCTTTIHWDHVGCVGNQTGSEITRTPKCGG
jgi:hypothetical protein